MLRVKWEADEADGGVYLLRDAETGQVMRTGRTGNFAVGRRSTRGMLRQRDLIFEPIYRTDVYAEQRGLEQELNWNTIRP